MTTTTLTARYLSFTDEARPDGVFIGRNSYIAVDGRAGMRKQAVLWFASPFPAGGANVASAKLRLWVRPDPDTLTRTINVGLAGQWGCRFGSLTWKTKPAISGAPATVSRTGALTAYTAFDFDVSPQMQRVANGEKFMGFVVTTASAEQIVIEYLSGRIPTLTVEWSQAPNAPTELAPSAGHVVGEQRPILRWAFWDTAGDTTLKQVQVQTATSATGFAAPAWDSGAVQVVAPELDLEQTSFPAPAAGAVVWWRVRHQDGAGLWSAWSQPTSFVFRPRPAVSLTSPTDSGLVSDPTPPVSWTSTAQARWRAAIYVRATSSSPWTEHDTSGVRIGAETSWQPTKPVRAGQLALAQVRVWDAYDRQSTPGVTDYVYDDQHFTYKASGASTGVTALTAVADWPGMGTTLTWSRAEQPDEWLITRDGVQVMRVPGVSLLKAGTQVVYEVAGLRSPSGENVWTVSPIINKSVSANGGTVTSHNNHHGTWLVDPETNDRVCIVGDVDHGTVTPEDSATFTPVGAQTSVVITSGMRGREGKIEGLIVPIPRMDPALVGVWRKNLLRFKTDRGLVLRLVSERDDIPVLINDVSVVPSQRVVDGVGCWSASLAFRQAGEFDFDGENL